MIIIKESVFCLSAGEEGVPVKHELENGPYGTGHEAESEECSDHCKISFFIYAFCAAEKNNKANGLKSAKEEMPVKNHICPEPNGELKYEMSDHDRSSFPIK